MDSECDQDMSLEQRITKDRNTSRKSNLQHKKFRKGVIFGFPLYRVVLLCLTLLDTALLIAALALGMYCAKVKDFEQASNSALTPLIIERDFLRNQTNVIKEKLATQMELENQRRAHMQMKVQLKQLQAITDSLQTHILALRAEKTSLEDKRTLLESNCGKCPRGWISFKTSCYYYSFSLSNSKKNWSDSRADCIRQGGDLLVINNLDEQIAINNNYPKITGTGPMWKMGSWIGLTDIVTTGVWVWVNNATENNTMYWQTDEHSNEESLGRHCAAFGRNIVSRKTWYTRNCENDELSWICEMESR
ncbi:C-type lectin domain family 12 member B-like [Periophthalmus magnuspinnatus]|uniref:C-type lectin domain family 12 member B-like n=1 Tax=Periophthalmus magnuspinnatus TaxID=409849 RepID=UPI002436D2F9|nr:C-type lectin domain family 12 member B-like [Periophthalmus magnuspinnatus]